MVHNISCKKNEMNKKDYKENTNVKHSERRNKKMNKNRNNGITLIALIITIIVLLILAGITVSMLTGDNGLLNKTSEAQFKSDLSSFKEQLEIFKTSKIMENNSFSEDTLNASADENTLQYNTKPAEETGNIEKIINNIDNKYKGKVEIIKGQLIYNTQSKQEIKWIQDLGLEANPYEINNGELASSEGNLLLMDSTGTLTIPSSVTKIGYGAFSGLSGLKKVIIPASVKEIGAYAFSNNKTLENVIIQGNLEKIGAYAFDGATNLKEINLPDSITEIGMRAFRYTAVTDIKLPENLTIISTDLFYECKLLSNIVLGNNLTTIQSGALQNTNISTIKLTEKIKDISGNSFYNCKNLQEIEIGNNKNFVYETGILMTKNRKNIVHIVNAVLNNQETFEIPEGVTTFSVDIKSYSLKKLVIPQSLESIWNGLLPETLENIVVKEGNSKLNSANGILCNNSNTLIACYSQNTEINIPEGIKEINSYAFQQAKNAEVINLPESLEKIGEYSFKNCMNLKKLNIAENVSEINSLFKMHNYAGTVNIDENNPYYTVKNNILYKKNGDKKETLVAVLYDIQDTMNIISEVKKIGDNAFYGQHNIKSIVIPNGVETIGKSFTFCSNLKTIEIPKSVKTINENCFSDATNNLEKIIIHNSENSISGAPWGAVKGMKVVEWKE